MRIPFVCVRSYEILHQSIKPYFFYFSKACFNIEVTGGNIGCSRIDEHRKGMARKMMSHSRAKQKVTKLQAAQLRGDIYVMYETHGI